MDSPEPELVRTLPGGLSDRLDHVPDRGAHSAVRWEPGRLTVGGQSIEHGRLAVGDQRVTLQVARSRTPRAVLGVVPWGHQHWLHVELRTARERLVDLRATADEALLEGLPWAADTDATSTDVGVLTGLIAAARGAGVELATWTHAETLSPDARERVVDEPQREPEPEPDDQTPPPRTQAEQRRRQIQPPRYLIATCLACMAVAPWFVEMGTLASGVGVMVILASIALTAPFAGPERLLLCVYGPCLLGGIALGQPWLVGALTPGDGYERMNWPVTDYGPVEFRFADHIDVVLVHAQITEATLDGERCKVAPVRPSDGARYGVRTWAFCCAPAEAQACTLSTDPKLGVVTRIDDATPAMDAAVDAAIAQHGVPINGRTFLSIAPPPPTGQHRGREIAFGVLALLVALGLANGLVYATPPQPKKKKT